MKQIRLPPGFSIHLYAEKVENARSMALGAQGTLFVGTRTAGKVYAIIDRDQDHRADQVITVAKGLNMPNGVAFFNGALYVAEVNRVLRYDRIEERLAQPPQAVIITAALPSEQSHAWKFIRFGPQGLLYISVGAPCNVCWHDDDRFATIMRMKPDGTALEIFAQGVRNSVGFNWHPHTKELWFTDNGRDWLGDDLPPDELNHAPQKGMFFGFPICHGKDIIDPQFGQPGACQGHIPPAMALGPHVAPLGMRFYTGTMFPDTYENQIFIAEHGSWNRSTPIGYRLTLVKLQGNRTVSYDVFAHGWLRDGKAWGRPVDIQVMPDGALLVSDDRAGAIYRICYESK